MNEAKRNEEVILLFSIPIHEITSLRQVQHKFFSFLSPRNDE